MAFQNFLRFTFLILISGTIMFFMQNCGSEGFQSSSSSDLDNIDSYLPVTNANSYFEIKGQFVSDEIFQTEVKGKGNLKKVAFYLNDQKNAFSTSEEEPFIARVDTDSLPVGAHSIRLVLTGEFYGKQENIERTVQFSTSPEPLDFEEENSKYVNFAQSEFLIGDNRTSSAAEVEHLFDDCYLDVSGCLMTNQQNFIELEFDLNEIVTLNKVSVMRSNLSGGEVLLLKIFVKETETDNYSEVASGEDINIHNWIDLNLGGITGQFVRILIFSAEDSTNTRAVEVRLMGNRNNE